MKKFIGNGVITFIGEIAENDTYLTLNQKYNTARMEANWTVEKKDEIERILIAKWAAVGMGIPDNYEDIVQDCYEDVCETADPVNWSEGDVSIAFRRWIQKQTKKRNNDYIKGN